jgi:hypothetical protein
LIAESIREVLMRLCTLLFLVAVLSIGFGRTDVESGTLRGVVHDVNGAVVPGARVVIQSWKSDMKNSGRVTYTIDPVLVTDSRGEFSSRLERGRYDIFISYPIFLPKAKRIEIEANKETTLDFELKDDPRTAGVVY